MLYAHVSFKYMNQVQYSCAVWNYGYCNMNIVGKPEQAACNRVLPRPVVYGDITLLLLVTLSCGVKNAEILWSFHQTPLYFHASGCTVMYCLRVHHWLHLQVKARYDCKMNEHTLSIRPTSLFGQKIGGIHGTFSLRHSHLVTQPGVIFSK